MKLETILPHLKDAVTLYELTALDVILLDLLVSESAILKAVPCKDKARMLRGLAHIFEMIAKEEKAAI